MAGMRWYGKPPLSPLLKKEGRQQRSSAVVQFPSINQPDIGLAGRGGSTEVERRGVSQNQLMAVRATAVGGTYACPPGISRTGP